MNQSINTDNKNSKEPQQKYRLGTVSIKILGAESKYKYGQQEQVTVRNYNILLMIVFAIVKLKDEEDTMKLQRDIDRLGSWAKKWGIRF